MNSDNGPVGKHWVSHFLHRQPRIALVVGRKLDAQRAQAATAEQLREFLGLYNRIQQQYNVQTEDSYNMEKTGIALEVYTNTRVLSKAGKKKAYVKSPEDRE